MADFNQETPPKRITDPDGIAAQMQFPAHLYRFVAPDANGEVPESSLVVAWVGTGRKKTPVYNEVLEVGTLEQTDKGTAVPYSDATHDANEKALEEALRAGWSRKPQFEAKKGAAREPKPPAGDNSKGGDPAGEQKK